MITPGIQENLRLISADKNDKGTLVVTFQQGSDAPSLIDSLSSMDSSAESDNGFFFWPFKADDRLTTPEAIAEDLIKRMQDFRHQLVHILEQYMAVKDPQGKDLVKFQPLDGLALASDQAFIDGLKDPAMRDLILAKVYDNFVTQFSKLITPFAGLNSPPMRMKLTRASKDKHFANIPRFIPFIEPMSVSKDQSKLKFTPYELGYRKGDPAGQPSAYSQADPTPVAGEGGAVSSQEATAVSALFGGNK